MKKFNAFTVSTLVVASCFSGCSRDDNKAASVENPTAAVSPVSLESTPTEQGELIKQMIKNRVQPITKSIVWGKTSFDDVILKLNYSSVVKPTTLRIGQDTPNGIKIMAIFPEYAVVNMPVDFGGDFGGFNDYGELNEGYYIQVAEHDFNNDSIPEIIVAVGNGSHDLVVNVIKYHAPASLEDAGRPENWELLGMFTGQQEAFIDGEAISLPFGSQGLYTEYTWVKTKFIKTN